MKINIQKNIVVVGSINCDQTSFLTQFPKVNQTIFAKSSSLSVGGKGLNQAIAAAKAGANVSMFACVGNDVFGQMAKSYLTENNIDISYLKEISETATGTANIFVNENSENMIAVSKGANACLLPEDIEKNASIIEQADLLIVQLEVPKETVLKALLIAKASDVTTIFNPAPAISSIEELIKLSTIITPNETEVEEIVGIYPDDEATCLEAVIKLRKLGATDVIITLGSKGFYISNGNDEKLVPAISVDAIDPTGAGDVFNGVLGVAFCE